MDRFLSVVAFAAAGLLAATSAGAQDRDVLWRIVNHCVGRDGKALPAPDANCPHLQEVWQSDPDYVAISDIKLTGWRPEFVHGLVTPRRDRVEDVEDPRRPDAIWDFAWRAAKTRIAEESEIALAVNPPTRRSQNQLHVHIVRLKEDGRQRLEQNVNRQTVRDPAEIWSVAAKLANSREFGVIVVGLAGGEFLVAVTDSSDSPEARYTQGRCAR